MNGKFFRCFVGTFMIFFNTSLFLMARIGENHNLKEEDLTAVEVLEEKTLEELTDQDRDKLRNLINQDQGVHINEKISISKRGNIEVENKQKTHKR